MSKQDEIEEEARKIQQDQLETRDRFCRRWNLPPEKYPEKMWSWEDCLGYARVVIENRYGLQKHVKKQRSIMNRGKRYGTRFRD